MIESFQAVRFCPLKPQAEGDGLKKQELSFDEIVRRQYEPLFLYCLKRAQGDEHLARECAAEAFMRAKKLGDPPDHPNIVGFLKRTASNVLHERLRERKDYYRHNVSLESILEDREGSGSLAPFFEREYAYLSELWQEDEPGADERIERIKEEILSSLPGSDRELMRMAYEEKLSAGAIAERTGRSKDAVRVKLSRLTDRVTEKVRAYFEEN